jgi:CBS domain-containing protein
MKVREIMRAVFTASPNITVKEAAKTMASKRIGSIVAIEKGKAVGIVTEGDVIEAVASDTNILICSISKIMSKKLLTVEPDDNIDDAAAIMRDNKIKRVPVVDEKGKLVGIVKITDVIANLDDISEASLF